MIAKITFTTAARSVQSLLFRHVLNHNSQVFISFSLFPYSVSNFMSKVYGRWSFPQQESRMYSNKIEQDGPQHSTQYALQQKTCLVHSVCQWTIPAASKRLTCMGRACYLHQFGKRAEVTSESYSGEFLPQLHTRTVYILKHEVSWASTILWHAYSFPHS